MTECGCRYWANQHGAGFVFCWDHGQTMQQVADARGISLQDAFDEAMDSFLEAVLP